MTNENNKKKRGRRFGGKNPNAGRRRKLIAGHSRLPGLFNHEAENDNQLQIIQEQPMQQQDSDLESEQVTDLATIESVAADLVTITMVDELEDPVDQSFDSVESPFEQMDEVSNSNRSLNNDDEVNTSSALSDEANANSAISDENKNDEDNNDEEFIESEEVELDKNQFNETYEELGSIEEISVVDNYLQSIQNRIRGNGMTDEYKNGTF